MAKSQYPDRSPQILTPGEEAVRGLMEARGGIRVSIYLNVDQAPPQTDKNAVRLENALTRAQDALVASGMEAGQTEAFLAPLRELSKDRAFWLDRKANLGLFLDPEQLQILDLPFTVEPRVTVAERFACKAILPILSENMPVTVLCLNREDIRCFRGDRFHLESIEVPDLPKAISDVIWPDDPERSIQAHSAKTVSASGRSGTAIAYAIHGQGLPDDLEDHQKERLFKAVAQATEHFLVNDNDVLIVIGVGDNIGQFHKASRENKRTVIDVLEDPASLNQNEFFAHVESALQPVIEKKRRALIDAVHESVGRGEGIVDLKQAAPAAALSRLEACLVAADRFRPGVCDPDNLKVSIATDPQAASCAIDLLDYIAVETVLHGGRALAVSEKDLPENSLVAAIPRY
ncbi:MAG: hypothetical protein ACFE0O_13455 [Opitutales bacterium]